MLPHDSKSPLTSSSDFPAANSRLTLHSIDLEKEFLRDNKTTRDNMMLLLHNAVLGGDWNRQVFPFFTDRKISKSVFTSAVLRNPTIAIWRHCGYQRPLKLLDLCESID